MTLPGYSEITDRLWLVNSWDVTIIQVEKGGKVSESGGSLAGDHIGHVISRSSVTIFDYKLLYPLYLLTMILQ